MISPILLQYLEKLRNYTSRENLKTVYKNIDSVKLKRKYIDLTTSGEYDARNNEISYIQKRSIGHEFLHMASSYYNKETALLEIGFKRGRFRKNSEGQEKFFGLGIGLNEGYTELLNSRIYNNKVKCYYKEVEIAKLFELFFDDPKKMEDYYFNHNLAGLVHYFEQFAPIEEVINLIATIDKITVSELQDNFTSIKEIEDGIKETLQKWLMKKKSSSEKQLESSKIPSKEETLSNRKIAIESIIPYRKMPFSKICSEIFQLSIDKINIIQATKLYCHVVNIEFPKKDLQKRKSLIERVECLLLPENEKTPLEKQIGNQLQKEIDDVLSEYQEIKSINKQTENKK